MKGKNSYHIFALITIVFWALAYVLTRLALQYFSAFPLGFLRYVIASATLVCVALATKMKPPKLRDLPLFALAGALGFFIYMIAFNQGQRSVSAATGSVVISTAPVLTALFAAAIYKERLSAVKWVAIAIEFAGVAVLTLITGVFSVNGGLLWLLLAAVALSLYNLLQRRLTRDYSAMQTSSFSIFFGTIMLAIFLPSSVREAANAPAIQWFYLAVLGIFSSAVAYVAWSQAFARAKQASQVSNYMFVTPFLTSLLGFLIAREVPEPSTLIGGGIILLGVFVFNFGDRLRKRRTPKG